MANSFRDYLENQSLFSFDTTTGQIIPQTGEVLSSVKDIMADIFDQKIDLSDETPAGRIAELIAVAIKRFASTTATYANQINPAYATGQMLDACGSIFHITRDGATPLVISCQFYGTPGTVIPSGSVIENSAGISFSIDSNMTIQDNGSVTGFATCTKSGNISVEIGSVNKIVSCVVGWSAVSNTGVAYPGSDIESDESFRSRVINLRWTGTAFVGAIRAEIKRVSGLKSVFVAENGSDADKYLNSNMQLVATEPVSGKYIKIAKNSIVVIADGTFLNSDVAKAIFSTKSAGCGYTKLDADSQGSDSDKGSVISIDITDDVSGVTYPVLFNRPLVNSFGVNINVIKNNYTGSVSDLIQDVKKAIISWAHGEVPFVDGIKIGQSIYSFEIGAAVSDVIPSIQIKSVAIIVGSTEYTLIELFINEIASLNESAINVTVS